MSCSPNMLLSRHTHTQSAHLMPHQVGTLLNPNDNNQKSCLTSWALPSPCLHSFYSFLSFLPWLLAGMLENGEVINYACACFDGKVSGGKGSGSALCTNGMRCPPPDALSRTPRLPCLKSPVPHFSEFLAQALPGTAWPFRLCIHLPHLA